MAALNGKSGSGMWDLRTASTSPGFSAANLSGGLGPLQQSTSAYTPSVSTSTGAAFDGNDMIQLPCCASDTFSTYLLIRKDPDSDRRYIFGSYLSGSFYDDGATAALTGVEIDGVVVTNRDQLHDGLDDDNFHMLSFLGRNISHFRVGWIGSAIEGDIVAVVTLKESEFANLSTAEGLVANWFAEISP